MGMLNYAKLANNQEKESKYVIRKSRKNRNERKMRGSVTPDTQNQSHSSVVPVRAESEKGQTLESLLDQPMSVSDEDQNGLPLDEELVDISMNNPQIKEALETLQNQTNCPITQNKWHRKFGPPTCWKGSPPPRGCEVFVGKIPRDLFEDELVPVLQKAGFIYEIRLMMETPCLNRGFAYVKYSNTSEAESAISALNNYEIRQRQFLGVMKSVDNNRLFIGGISKTRRQDELFSEMTRLTDDVLNVILYSDANDKSRNRGFAFVEYKNHSAASIARQKLMKNPPLLWGTNQVKVDWAEPEREVDEQTMMKVRVLYVRNLALTTTEQHLRDLFALSGGAIERVKKMKDYAFIHFNTREDAEKAKKKFQGHILDGCEIDINWSKPVANREEYQQRKAASKAMLSSSNLQTVLPAATLAVNGDFLYGTRVRNAAGAQGYSTPKPYLPRPRSENSLSSLQPAQIMLQNPFLTGVPYRSPLETLGFQTIPSIYPQERVTAIEDSMSSAAELQYQYAQPAASVPRSYFPSAAMMNVLPQMPSNWQSQAAYLPHQISQPGLIPSYYIPQTGMVMDGQYGSAFSYPQYLPGQMLTQVPGISGSNMSIDRS